MNRGHIKTLQTDQESTVKHILLHSDTLKALRTLRDESIDSIVTDPPYGLSKEPNMAEVLTHWLNGDDYSHRGGGFMGKAWDSFVPGPSVWRECLRVLKPGGHLLCFAGSRTVDLMGISIRLAGFEVRDQMQWLYGSGFPKSMDVSKAIDKMAGAERKVIGKSNRCVGPSQAGDNGIGTFKESNWQDSNLITSPATDEAAQWEGWGSALKPAHEPIIVARKPLSVGGKKATVAKNVLEHGTGAINIDGSRIGRALDDPASGWSETGSKASENQAMESVNYEREAKPDNAAGRWPANVLLTHHEECEQVGTRTVKSGVATNRNRGQRIPSTVNYANHDGQDVTYGDEKGNETVEAWECHEDCPVAILDAQSGERKAGGKVKGHEPSRTGQNGIYGVWGRVENAPYADTGGASRFFYCAKTSKSERNAGMPEGTSNKHPTVKPVKLMAYLVRMVTPPGGTVLDPYIGSGTTGVACEAEGFGLIGIDNDLSYLVVAKHRIGESAKIEQPPTKGEGDGVMRVHFTIPVRFSDEPHPLGCTPDDWFDVEVPEGIGDPDLVARDAAIAAVGKAGWMTTYFDGPDWDEVRSTYAPGSCQVVLRADPSEGQSS